MNERVLKVLEFHKVRKELAKHASCSLGKERAEALHPSSDFETVKEWHAQTDEAATVVRKKGHVPMGGVSDIRPHVKRAEIGGGLNPQELSQIAQTIYGGQQIKRFIEPLAEEEIEIPFLLQLADQIHGLVELRRQIEQCIDEQGDVSDSASHALGSIRRNRRSTEARVRDKLSQMTKSSSTQKMLSDTIITIRNDRFVLPVKQEYRQSIGGLVHDQSSSGQTLFIEPQAVVGMNNELRELRLKEKEEVDRILRELSAEVALHTADLLENVETLAHFDFLFAKAFYGEAIKGSRPALDPNGYAVIKKARHPLLPYNEAIPSDIELGGDVHTMVITGPNTGGKTVTLKTFGLISLMGQSGLYIPAQDGSTIAVFENVYADIGDEQSIEQSLSTFSSHMTQIVDILKHVGTQSLVLFDELGAGTDPQEGAALAMAILDEVHKKGAHTIATTHYPELKAYGYNREGVINASVEFNTDTLKPTYRLLIGVPGRSNAFDISRRLGLAESIVSQASEQVGTESHKVNNMILSLEEARKKAEEDRNRAEERLQEVQELQRSLETELQDFQEEREVMFQKAEEKAEKSLAKAKAEAEEILQSLREMQNRAGHGVKDHELIEAKKRLEEASPKLAGGNKKAVKKPRHQNLQVGDEVKHLTFGQHGHIINKRSEDEYEVQLGVLKMKVSKADLLYISRPEPIETKPIATVRGRGPSIKTELDLRGERYEDALQRLEKYLDEAMLAGYPLVTIIHGKGTGALRKGVQQYAKNHRAVTKTRSGEAGEGGSGVTIFELK
ncbi:endonuclease MutS2 [Aureibacillus halotolerans]|uniref:Endonuclease MutS2 n=1 Tax=Aureibacillus halotolerans TaxID=1508390 RepID=A0A4R6U417_9BACI|nr:endonuclease MutS2 [Aureibacillus halotolerans]TDQ39175.1 DNA mismatch repair protein MutS2 [Aureibacillus halotolerans]